MRESLSIKNRWFLLFLLIWGIQMCTAVYFCFQKQGFHEDEYYSYYSTARTYGLVVEDGTWMERNTILDEFSVREGEGFQYGLVKEVQSWDVHPPVYYWILHTVCSFFPGRFSKWFGLGINLAAFGISMFLLWTLTLQITGEREDLSCLVCFFYGFTPAVLSSVVFIRMYALLTVFVYLCAILHMAELGRICEKMTAQNVPGEPSVSSGYTVLSAKKFLFPLGIVTYLGFLTQYYYFIFLFFMALAFCLYLLWRERRLWNCIRYGISLAIAFLLAYITYPSCLGQMFRGQRGAQATENFFDISNTWERISFFSGLLNDYVFMGMLPVLILLILLLLLYILIKRIRGRETESGEWTGRSIIESDRRIFPTLIVEKDFGYLLLFVTVTGYFLTTAKTALLLGATSVRYQQPVYGMVVLLVFGAIGRLIASGGSHNLQAKWILMTAVVVCAAVNMIGLRSDKVVFLYPEDRAQVAFAKEQAAQETPAIYLYDSGQSWCIWDVTNELLEYPAVYFTDIREETPITENKIAEANTVVVYVSNISGLETKTCLERIFAGNPNLSGYELKYREKYCDVYYLYMAGRYYTIANHIFLCYTKHAVLDKWRINMAGK